MDWPTTKEHPYLKLNKNIRPKDGCFYYLADYKIGGLAATKLMLAPAYRLMADLSAVEASSFPTGLPSFAATSANDILFARKPF